MPGPISIRNGAAAASTPNTATKVARPTPCRAFSLTAPEAPVETKAAARPAGPLSAPPPPSPAAESAKKLVARMLDDEAAVDRGLHNALSGKQMSAQELLVLQAQVIQYSQELEVASRVVDKATGAVRQVLQTQV
jgi:hypothetical protein